MSLCVFVMLTDGTVGRLWDGKAEVGTIVTVQLHDENGNRVRKTGEVKEVL